MAYTAARARVAVFDSHFLVALQERRLVVFGLDATRKSLSPENRCAPSRPVLRSLNLMARTFLLPQLSLLRSRRDPIGMLERLRERQGDVAVAFLGRQRLIFLLDADLVEEAFVRRAKRSDKKNGATRWWLRRPELTRYGPLMATHDRDAHRAARRALHPVFSKERAREDVTLMNTTMSRLLEQAANRQSCDLQTLTAALFVGGFLGSVFGNETVSLDEAELWMQLRYQTGEYAGLPTFTSRISGLSYHARHLLHPARLQRALQANEQLLALTKAQVVQPKRRTMADCFSMAGAGSNVLGIMNFIVNAAEASANMMRCWVALSDPNLASLLEAEAASASLDADFGQLPLHRGAVLEALRLVSPVHVARYCQQPFQIAGIDVGENDLIFTSPYLLQRDPRWWSEPERFQPERWLPEAEAARPRSSFLVFGARGPRLCPGRHQSIALMHTALLLFTRCWQIEWLDEPAGLGWKMRLGTDDIKPDRSLRVRILPRP
jgi:cytochrome P450